jgi:hypothetical protein
VFEFVGSATEPGESFEFSACPERDLLGKSCGVNELSVRSGEIMIGPAFDTLPTNPQLTESEPLRYNTVPLNNGLNAY